MWSRLLGIAILTFVWLSPRLAGAIPTDFEGWFTTTTLSPLDDEGRYHLYLELQPRVGDDWQRMALLVVRPAVVFDTTENLSLYAGYAWVPKFYNQEYHRDYRDEQRLWQQLLFKHSYRGVTWQHRLRQEQRVPAGADGISNRSRYLIRGSRVVSDRYNLGLTTYSETLINLNGVAGGPSGGFEQNRFFIGPYWEHDKSRYEIGYLGEYDRRFGDSARWVNAVSVLASFSF